MCRWLAYVGSPLPLDELLYRPRHSLIDQSLHAQMGKGTTNGDGVGVGWWGESEVPGLYRSVEPAWSDRNLREISAQVRARGVFAHVRASTGTAVQQTNCHPFRHGRWLLMHNGVVGGFHSVRRELMLAVDPGLFADIAGSTDSEVLFFLALTFGLDKDPPTAVARAAGLVERVGRAHGVAEPLRMTLAVGDGERVWAFRYSSGGRSPSLFHTESVATMKAQYPDNAFVHDLTVESRLVVSEPFAGIAGAWREAPEGSCCIVGRGKDEIRPFAPKD